MSILIFVRGRSLLGFSRGLGVALGLLALVGCGASDPPPLGSLDPNSTTFPGVMSAANTATGTTGPVMACVPEAPPSEQITDFSDWSGMDWGGQGALTGKSFKYQGEAPSMIEYLLDSAQANMHITATVANYVGFGLEFGPCTDATAYSGIQFDLWGTAGSAVFQVQTSEDQNKDYDDPMAVCSEAESGTCALPQARLTAITDTPTTLQFAWDDFSGGSPVPTLSPNQIIGLQWQFECGEAEPCPVDVRLDNVKFY